MGGQPLTFLAYSLGMPKYKIEFKVPVLYLPDHVKGRTVSELYVNAPSEQAALIHAIRVVQGDVGEPVVTLAADEQPLAW